MSKEEPAWKAELRSAVLNAVIDSENQRGLRWTPTTDAVVATLEPHIKAAEQRGREAALREVADVFTADAERSDEPRRTEILGAVAYLLRNRADNQ